MKVTAMRLAVVLAALLCLGAASSACAQQPAGFEGPADLGFWRILGETSAGSAVDVLGSKYAERELGAAFIERNRVMREGLVWKKAAGTLAVSGIIYVVGKHNPGAARWMKRGWIGVNVGLGVYAVTLTF